MNQVDLHCHTTASDGVLTPDQLISRAAHLALAVVAVTDHDSVEGVPAARATGEALGVEVIPGVEINTDVPGAEVHILGYFVDPDDAYLGAELARLREGRLARARAMVDKLAEIGAPVSLERVLQLSRGGSVGRPHVAQALIEAGHVSGFGQAFDLYLGRNSPAYIERMKFSPAEACQLIRRAGGVPSLAHPILFDAGGAVKDALPLDDLLPDLVAAGLMGLEVYYPGYGARTTERLMALARHYGLLVTGGTDFHGAQAERLDLGGLYVPMKAVHRLRAAWQNLH